MLTTTMPLAPYRIGLTRTVLEALLRDCAPDDMHSDAVLTHAVYDSDSQTLWCYYVSEGNPAEPGMHPREGDVVAGDRVFSWALRDRNEVKQ